MEINKKSSNLEEYEKRVEDGKPFTLYSALVLIFLFAIIALCSAHYNSTKTANEYIKLFQSIPFAFLTSVGAVFCKYAIFDTYRMPFKWWMILIGILGMIAIGIITNNFQWQGGLLIFVTTLFTFTADAALLDTIKYDERKDIIKEVKSKAAMSQVMK